MHIRPGSLWLAYSLTQPQAIQKLMPSGLDLVSAPILADDMAHFQPKKLLFNAYDVDSPWMHGTRVDVAVLARHVDTGKLHLVLIDCFSNTLRWDPIHGVRRANAYTRASCANKDDAYKLTIRNMRDEFDVRAAISPQRRGIDWKFAVEANLACYWAGFPDAFSMSFNETSIALPVATLKSTVIKNTLWKDVRASIPTHAFIHPHPMDFEVDVTSFRVTDNQI